MTQTEWVAVGLAAGGATYLFRAAPFLIGPASPLRGPLLVRFATLTSLAVTAGLVSSSVIGNAHDLQGMGIKMAAILVALTLATRFRGALVPLFTAVTLASIARILL